MSDAVRYEVTDRIATITLNRPHRKNAGDPAMLEHLLAALRRARAARDVRAVILTGSGDAFCAGADLTPAGMAQLPQDRSPGQGVRWFLEYGWNAVVSNIVALGKPTVAAVGGVAAGGGVGLALACDIVVAAESATFIQPFVPQLAALPDVGSTWFVPRLVGPARARALMLLGEPLAAATAAQWGLIWRAVPDAELTAATRGIATRLAALDAEAARQLNAALTVSDINGLFTQLALEARWQGELVDRPACAEGVTAFLEKRAPDFTTVAPN